MGALGPLVEKVDALEARVEAVSSTVDGLVQHTFKEGDLVKGTGLSFPPAITGFEMQLKRWYKP